ncbi:RNA polymerase sigma factor [Streptosporangium saharense]|uniref:RNA polymerase sigma-70 factor (ECF subfamily) n=1 Tax=Streptosporangium saharense TaxID=1706840 RepID=A0A7W7QTX0_9ACTN|nr:RNA polymerase sigma factor [Streptosporangium saharense]MBB4919151.1 RNA polymerase sigma-70 factor (ECF subfamily) [Streptosporangium saharense]
MDPDDAEVIERARRDPDSFSALFDRHAPALHRYVTRRLGDSLADDIVADTFLTAFRRLGRYDVGHRDARPWLYGIAANLIGKHRRAEVRAYRALARTGLDEVAESYADRVDARVTALAAHRELAGALAVLLMIAWADFSYEEVAQALGIPLGIPIGTVRSRLHRARKKTREALGGTDPSAVKEESGRGWPEAAERPARRRARARRRPPALPARVP